MPKLIPSCDSLCCPNPSIFRLIIYQLGGNVWGSVMYAAQWIGMTQLMKHNGFKSIKLELRHLHSSQGIHHHFLISLGWGMPKVCNLIIAMPSIWGMALMHHLLQLYYLPNWAILAMVHLITDFTGGMVNSLPGAVLIEKQHRSKTSANKILTWIRIFLSAYDLSFLVLGVHVGNFFFLLYLGGVSRLPHTHYVAQEQQLPYLFGRKGLRHCSGSGMVGCWNAANIGF